MQRFHWHQSDCENSMNRTEGNDYHYVHRRSNRNLRMGNNLFCCNINMQIFFNTNGWIVIFFLEWPSLIVEILPYKNVHDVLYRLSDYISSSLCLVLKFFFLDCIFLLMSCYFILKIFLQALWYNLYMDFRLHFRDF